MGLTRRNLGLAAIGGALGGKQALRDVGKAISDGVSMGGPLRRDWGQTSEVYAANVESVEEQRRRLLDRKADYERQARGEFDDDEVRGTKLRDAAVEGIMVLRSVSAAGKAHMLNALSQRREREHMQQQAIYELRDIEMILKRLAGLG